MRKGIVFCVTAVLLVCSLCLNWLLCCENGKGRIETDTTRVTVVDTVPYVKPVARDSVVVRNVTKKLPIVHDTVHPICIDSADVNIPITQKQYCDSTYTAWVSGYEPSLDSIRVYKKREVVTVSKIIKEPHNRFVISLNIGYGLTPYNGLQPYIGVGVGYKLFSFGK
uniref:DUF6808 domain-containing protein n=1 Tax=Siphoviridae sp. ctA4S13 TaxID=2826179 RepID=A0A8S5MQA8_9CAUD|nr:MAG TPA: hypothetical protein [Siphoviridae sp. ctA4S13]DAG37751.1 MAG TPA: hypothetical protein [Caudoviricetes sp.]